MTTLAQLFGSSTSFTLNTTTWAQAVTVSSNAVNVAGIATVPDDILVTINLTIPNSTLADQFAANVYVSCSEDGTHFDDNDQYSGSNNSQTTLRSPTNFSGPLPINCTQNKVIAKTFSLLGLLGWRTLPREFGIILENQCGQTIATFSASYTPVNFTNS